MSIDKNTFDNIFGFNRGMSPEEGILYALDVHSKNEFDKLFSAVQMYDYGLYLSMRFEEIHEGSFEVIRGRVYRFISRIFDTVDILNIASQGDISLYRDEFDKIGDMFDDLLGYYEGIEDYERCSYFLRIRDDFFLKIKILND
jgi:hypothetical protein